MAFQYLEIEIIIDGRLEREVRQTGKKSHSVSPYIRIMQYGGLDTPGLNQK